MDFSYRTIEERIEITAYHGSNSVVYVPEEIDGRSVTVIGKYAFEGNNDILEVVLPDSVERIGSHAFYNCRRVEKMRMSDRIVETEDGAFKNCRSLREFQIRVILHKMTCLKNLLSELSQELHITLEYTGQEQSRLVFPRYLYDYEDNVQARIINQVTYGSGVHYRECMKERAIDYRGYDETFHVALCQDTVNTLFTIARYRLNDSYELTQEAAAVYQNYIVEHLKEIIEIALKESNQEALLFLLGQEYINPENVEEVLVLAHQQGNTESVGILLDYKNQHWKIKKKEFVL